MTDLKPFKENPFLQSDLDREAKPGQVYQAPDSVIPVRTWARGSPFRQRRDLAAAQAGERSTSKGSVGSGAGSSGEYGDLEKYWPGEGEDLPQDEIDNIDDTEPMPIKFGRHDDDDEIEVLADNDDNDMNNNYDGESFLDDSGRPELASVGGHKAEGDNPNNSFIEAFNQVYAQYKQETIGLDNENDDDDDGTASSYEESQRAFAKLNKHLSQSSLNPATKGLTEEGNAQDEKIGDLAAYLGLGSTEGENVFFNNEPGFEPGDENYGGDDAFDDYEDDEEIDPDDFLPVKKQGSWSYDPRPESNEGRGAVASKSSKEAPAMTRSEVMGIVCEYQDIYAAMQSPRDERKDPKSKQNMFAKELKLLKKAKIPTNGGGNASSKKSVALSESVLRRAKKVKQRAGSDSDDDLQGKDDVQRDNNDRADAEQRHRLYLQEVASKRKQEDEMLMRLAIKAERRRKKFKEALLEKALRARAMAEAATAEQVAATTAPSKGKGKLLDAKDVDIPDEKKEVAAALRKRFKEQHRKMLDDLMNKNKEDEKAREDIAMRELERRARAKKRSLKLAKKEEADGDEPASDDKDADEEGVEVYQEALALALGAGSALSAVRQLHSRSQGTGAGNLDDKGSDAKPEKKSAAAVQGKDTADIPANEGLSDEQKAAKKLQAQLQKAKVAAYLLALSDNKKKEDSERRKAAERAKKRAYLLSTRIMSEANERKAMTAEDKPRHRTIAMEKEQEKTSGVSKRVVPAAKKPASAIDKKEDDEVGGKTVLEKTFKLPPKVVGGSVITTEAAEALFQRLKAKQAKTAEGVDALANCSVPARDFADWKRKNAVPADGLVFAMTGWYPCVKQELLDRGWYFNADTQSPYFDLKWTLRSMECDQDLLQPWQLTNHFMKNVAITTKVGLIKSLQGLVWLADVEANDVIPRGYDLSIPQEMQTFIDDFRCQRAENLLKSVYEAATGVKFPPVDINGLGVPVTVPPIDDDEDNHQDDDEEDDEDDPEAFPKESKAPKQDKASKIPQVVSIQCDESEEWILPKTPRASSLAEIKVNMAVFRAACEVVESALNPLNDAFLDIPLTKEQHEDNPEQITGLQWELLSSFDVFSCSRALPLEPELAIDAFLQEKEERSSGNSNSIVAQRKKSKERSAAAQRNISAVEVAKLVTLTEKDVQRIHHLLCSMSRLYRAQARLNGQGCSARNIWIVKPAAKSRGRGITTFNDIGKLLKYVDAGTGGSQSSQWIVQKYMENPLTIANHKFDLRQWVLVTDWNPLTVYFYDECYARFSVEEYSTKESDLENAYVHLVNNSISKNSEMFHKVVTAENGETIEGFMWDQSQFQDYVQYRTGQDLMTTKIQPRMKEIAKWSLMCASECIEHRKNSWELYGFDFMVDDSYNAWLIEINSSPACDYSTSVTEKYVKKALVELLKVTLDVRTWESASKKSRGDRPDTGGWEMIHKGPLLEMPAAAFGTDLTVGGTGLKSKQRAATAAIPSSSYTTNGALRASTSKGAGGLSVSGVTATAPSEPAKQAPRPALKTRSVEKVEHVDRPNRDSKETPSESDSKEREHRMFPQPPVHPQSSGPSAPRGPSSSIKVAPPSKSTRSAFNASASISDSLDGDSIVDEGLGIEPLTVVNLLGAAKATIVGHSASLFQCESKENTFSNQSSNNASLQQAQIQGVRADAPPMHSGPAVPKVVPVPPVGRNSAPVKIKTFDLPF